MSQYQRFKDKEEYLLLLKFFIHKYDQYYNPDVMEYSLKALSESSENIQNLWLDIILSLSTRNNDFDEDYLSELLGFIKAQNEDIVFKIIYNSVNNLVQIESNFVEQISNEFNSDKYQSNIWRVLVKITKMWEVSKELVDNLIKYYKKNSDDSELVFEIFMNLILKSNQLPIKEQLYAFINYCINSI